MGKIVPLGDNSNTVSEVVPKTNEERLVALEAQVRDLTKAILHMNINATKAVRRTQLKLPGSININKDGLPPDITLWGSVKNGGMRVVTADGGSYCSGNERYASLEEATEALIGPGADPWEFWLTVDNSPIKKVYQKR